VFDREQSPVDGSQHWLEDFQEKLGNLELELSIEKEQRALVGADLNLVREQHREALEALEAQRAERYYMLRYAYTVLTLCSHCADNLLMPC
jgi:hypothetical protein